MDPKALVGVKKVPMYLLPRVAKIEQAMAHEDGAVKYGPYNWRDNKVKITTYLSAIERHLDALVDGEDYAQDSNIHHAGHIMATCAIILDALSLDMLIDDRPTSGLAADVQLLKQTILEDKNDVTN